LNDLELSLEHHVDKRGNVYQYYNINGYLIPKATQISLEFDIKPSTTIFKTIKEARYCSMLVDLGRGKNINNYRSSKYYKYYLSRLKKDHPEYLI